MLYIDHEISSLIYPGHFFMLAVKKAGFASMTYELNWLGLAISAYTVPNLPHLFKLCMGRIPKSPLVYSFSYDWQYWVEVGEWFLLPPLLILCRCPKSIGEHLCRYVLGALLKNSTLCIAFVHKTTQKAMGLLFARNKADTANLSVLLKSFK